MDPIIVEITVTRDNALKARKASYGATRVKLTQEFIDTLTEREMRELIDGTHFGLFGEDFQFTEPSLSELRQCLKVRADKRDDKLHKEALEYDAGAKDAIAEWETWFAWADKTESLLDPDSQPPLYRWFERPPSPHRLSPAGTRAFEEVTMTYAKRFAPYKARFDEECKSSEAARKAADEAARKKKIEARKRFDAEREAWIQAHGSERLRLMVAEGIPCSQTYRDERLAAERPGWEWRDGVCGVERDIRDPELAVLRMYTDAKASDPNVKLVWWADADGSHVNDCGHRNAYGDTLEIECGPALISTFLGRETVKLLYGV